MVISTLISPLSKETLCICNYSLYLIMKALIKAVLSNLKQFLVTFCVFYITSSAVKSTFFLVVFVVNLFLNFPFKMHITTEQAARSIYGLKVSFDNYTLATKLLCVADLEPITIVNSDPTFTVAISTEKLSMESWKFKRLRSTIHLIADAEITAHNLSQTSTVATDEYHFECKR
ncbi:uncharacterized protein BX663DRAFT_515634 [Cokeromyces recurvatus]|uniref:uncharacterized protein n=1 Tax=Cokeromyces recurvatus TaxID=90255 RepID=UPI00221F26F0|nr:uncharacterized protein BX663DRAFT_515634 [Cokeromyces recurvatus]KAI7900895.1 hypothetical protein BX663DRAFT_515634 [Cokeromyces recurvatus]